MGQKRILVVDDEDVLRDVLAEILTREGHQVDTACDGRYPGWTARDCMQPFGSAKV
jgi:CheY-like chemotaxis protein